MLPCPLTNLTIPFPNTLSYNPFKDVYIVFILSHIFYGEATMQAPSMKVSFPRDPSAFDNTLAPNENPIVNTYLLYGLQYSL